MQLEKYYKTKAGGVFDCKCDAAFTLLQADASLFALMGYTREEFKERFQDGLYFAIYEEEREHILEEIDRQVRKDGVFMYENRLVCKDGSLKWIWISAQLMCMEDGERYFHCIFHDIEDEKRNQQTLKISEKRLDYILAQTQDIIFEYDCRLNEVYYSDNLEKKFGYTIPTEGFPDSLFLSKIIYPDDEFTVRNAFQSMRRGKDHMHCEYRLKYHDKGYRWVHAQATTLRDEDGTLLKMLGIITDIHERKQEILKSREEAALDPLTGLYNRRECLRRLEDYIAVNNEMLAFMLIDIDDFKHINDTYGHAKGDEVLVRIAEELKSVIRADDITARIGGDEFVICLMNLPDCHVAVNKAERILDVFNEVLCHELQCEVSSSIGISFYPEHGSDYDKLLEHADIAMYQAKKEGKNQFRVFADQSLVHKCVVRPQKYMKKGFHDHIIEQVMRILLENRDKEQALISVLKLTGRVFDCDRISIYHKKDGCLQRCDEWLSDEIYHIEETDIPIVKQLQGRESNHRKTLAFVNVKNIEDEVLQDWFVKRRALAAVVCTIKQDVEVNMIVCFEDCHSLRNGSGEERYTLRMISEIIHLFLR